MTQNTTTLSDLASLPTTLPVWSATGPSAASILRIGRSLAWEMSRRGDLPTIRCGHAVRVSTSRLLAMLGEKP